MNTRIMPAAFLVLLFTATLKPPLYPQGPGAKQQSDSEKKAADFRWLDPSGENVGMKLETQQLGRISLGGPYGSSSEAEKETVPIGSEGKRATTRVYDIDANGNRFLVETVVEELRNLPGDRTQAVRTVTRRDANGRMQTVRKYTQETAPSGSATYQTKATLHLPGLSGALAPAEQVIQNERAKAGDQIEIDRTQMVPGPGGGWQPRERRVSTTQKSAQQSSTEEMVYRYDTNGAAQLGERLSGKEWRDQQGNYVRDVTTYRSDPGGRLSRVGRTQIRSESLPDGAKRTTQILEEQNPAAPSEGLRLVEQVTEQTRPVGTSGTEREVWVQAPDANGRPGTLYYQKTVEKK